MGQQPNIEIDADLRPRSRPEPGVSGGWKPGRPGEIGSPQDMPVGGVFGNPSPDTGWVLKLIKNAEFDRSSDAIESVVAMIASVRASVFGRGPVPEDVEAALLVLGLRTDGLEAEMIGRLDEQRARWLSKVPHEAVRGRSVLDDIDRAFLHQSLHDIRTGLLTRLS
jgi:hypothetical protein